MRDPLLSPAEVTEALDGLSDWTSDGVALSRSVTAESFPAAIAWVVAIATAAEDLDHHPDIDIRWRTIGLLLTTHDSGGLTWRDVELARRIDAITGTD